MEVIGPSAPRCRPSTLHLPLNAAADVNEQRYYSTDTASFSSAPSPRQAASPAESSRSEVPHVALGDCNLIVLRTHDSVAGDEDDTHNRLTMNEEDSEVEKSFCSRSQDLYDRILLLNSQDCSDDLAVSGAANGDGAQQQLDDVIRRHGIHFVNRELSWTDCQAICHVLAAYGGGGDGENGGAGVVRTVVLRGCRVPNATHLLALLASLRHCRFLATLELSALGLGARHMPLVAQAVAASRRTLRRLVLDGNRVGGVGVEALTASVRRCARLHRLGLGDCHLSSYAADGRPSEDGDGSDDGREAMIAVRRILSGCRRLCRVDLRGNAINDRSLAELEPGLASSLLQELDLRRNSLTAAAAPSLSHVLYFSFALRRLCLSGNRIGDRGLRRLRDSLATCTGVEQAQFYDVGVTSSSLDTLASLLLCWPALECLEIGGRSNDFSQATIRQQQSFVSSVRCSGSLVRLSMPSEAVAGGRGTTRSLRSDFAYRLLCLSEMPHLVVYLGDECLLGRNVTMTCQTSSEVVFTRSARR